MGFLESSAQMAQMDQVQQREITNVAQMIHYIRLMLGEPLIQVELNDQHISQCIADTIKIYTDVVYGFFDDQKIVALSKNPLDTNSEKDYNSFRLIDWDEVTDIQSLDGSKRFIFKWDSIKRICRILDASTPDKVLVQGQKRYQVDPVFDLIYNEQWVKAFAKAKTQLLWGQVLGKYSQNLVGGATVNYDRLISEAQQEIDRLYEELNDRWVDPAPVMVS